LGASADSEYVLESLLISIQLMLDNNTATVDKITEVLTEMDVISMVCTNDTLGSAFVWRGHALLCLVHIQQQKYDLAIEKLQSVLDQQQRYFGEPHASFEYTLG
jgi:hypothetical protein